MPLPTPSAAAAAAAAATDHDASASFIWDDEETTEKSATNRAATTAAAAATTGTAPRTESIATPGVADPEHVSILTIITSVNASADIRKFALATWRGAENRDGFVLDMERFVVFHCFGIFRVFTVLATLHEVQVDRRHGKRAIPLRCVQALPCILHAQLWRHQATYLDSSSL